MATEIGDDMVGKLLLVRPIYGYGWFNMGEFAVRNEVPAPFACRVTRLICQNGYRIGFFGIVESPEHLFDRCGTVCVARNGDQPISLDDIRGPVGCVVARGDLIVNEGMVVGAPAECIKSGSDRAQGHVVLAPWRGLDLTGELR